MIKKHKTKIAVGAAAGALLLPGARAYEVVGTAKDRAAAAKTGALFFNRFVSDIVFFLVYVLFYGFFWCFILGFFLIFYSDFFIVVRSDLMLNRSPLQN